MGAHPPFRHFESARVRPNKANIEPKLVEWPALLIASVFNCLGQYASSPGNKAYCYEKLPFVS